MKNETGIAENGLTGIWNLNLELTGIWDWGPPINIPLDNNMMSPMHPSADNTHHAEKSPLYPRQAKCAWLATLA